MSNSLREEWAEVCDERDKLRVENARLRGELDRLFAGDAPAQTVRAENTRLRGLLAQWNDASGAVRVATLTWRAASDAGAVTATVKSDLDAAWLRYRTAEVALREAAGTSDKSAIRQPAPDVQAALADALEQVKAALGDRLLGNGPLSKEYAHGVMRQINAALTLAGRKP